MLCRICWRAPWPTQPAAAGYMALGALHDLRGLGTVAFLSAGTPLSSCRSCESFTVRRGGGPGWAPPGVQAGPIGQYILGSRQLQRGEASSGSSCPHLWELGSPGGALPASAGHHPDKLWEGIGGGGEEAAVRAQLRALSPNLPQIGVPLSMATAPNSMLVPHIHSTPPSPSPT